MRGKGSKEMKEITVCFQQDDYELIDDLKRYFDDDIKFQKTKSFDGYEVLFTAIIPIMALTVQTIDFFFSHFSQKKNSGRFIKTKEGTLILDGFTKDEIIQILENIEE